MVIDSATMSADEEGENKDYSEWRLFNRGFRSCYDYVTVNEGFQNRDFQTSQGAVSVIDAELLGRLRHEALVIDNECERRAFLPLPLFVPYGLLLMHGLNFLDDVLPIGVVLSFFVVGSLSPWFLFAIHVSYQMKVADDKFTTLLAIYQPQFLQASGVKLGRGAFVIGDDERPSVGLYFRHPRRSVDNIVLPLSKDAHADCEDTDWHFPPVFLYRLIPGEIHIEETEHDAASMKGVDAATWALLQSTHEEMIQGHICLALFVVLFSIVFFVAIIWACFGGDLAIIFGVHFTFFVVGFFCCIVGPCFKKYQIPRACEKVATRVNEALQQQEEKAHLAVEFHASELPGREGVLSRRYQFVLRRGQEGALSTLRPACEQEMV